MVKKDNKTDVIDPESDDTQDASPADQKTPEDDSDTGESASTGVKQPDSDTEQVWENLSGRTQDRIQELVRRTKKAEAKAERVEQELVRRGSIHANELSPSLVDTGAPNEAEVQQAIKTLREKGKFVTQEDLYSLQGELYRSREHERLTQKYDGSDGLPRYDPEEVEDHAKTHYFGGNFEAAYRDMYWDELVDAEATKRRPQQKSKTYTEKPTASVRIGEKPLTVESLRERLRQPDGPEWWAKNKGKIEPLLTKLSQA